MVLSNNHNCKGIPAGAFYDICDELQGRYPKDFKFTGWHPHCRCHVVSVLKTPKELAEENEAIMKGETPSRDSVNTVRNVPENFAEWTKRNEERIARAKYRPYFVRDNQRMIDNILNPQKPSALDIAKERHAKRTPEQIEAIKREWRLRNAKLRDEINLETSIKNSIFGVKYGRTATKKAIKLYENTPAPTFADEIKTNTLDIARIMGLPTPIPMTFIEANQGKANLSWGKGIMYSENCQSCVVVHEARLRGLNITALGYDNRTGSVSYMLGEHYEKAWISPKTGKIPQVTIIKGYSEQELFLKLYKQTLSEGRYHIGINFKNGTGHVITAERFKTGDILFYDAQNGEFLNIEELSSIDYFELLKVDNKLINKEVIVAISKIIH